MIFKMEDGGHLGFSHKKGTKTQKITKNNHFRVFGMPMLVKIDTLIVRLAHLGPEI